MNKRVKKSEKVKYAKKVDIESPKKETRRGKKRKFIATVMERFSDTFEVWAENEEEAREMVENGIPEEYSPAQTGGGYDRTIDIDPD
jgi:hypothetical protein